MVTIGVVISTQGRSSLNRTLHSITQQGPANGHRVVVIGDGIAEPLASQVQALVSLHGFEFYNRPREEGRWGHGHVNYGLDLLHNTVDLVTVQDDDDIYAPRAFDLIRENHEPDTLLMARSLNQSHGLLWREPKWGVPLIPGVQGSYLAKSGITAQDGHSAFIPGNVKKMPKFGPTYIGDQQYLLQCSILFAGKTKWLDIITTITRPEHTLQFKLWPFLVQTPEQAEVLRILRNECRMSMTGSQDYIQYEDQQNWWASRNPDFLQKYWIFSDTPNGDNWVGFGLIRKDWSVYDKDYNTWTCGVAEKYRRKGYGTEIAKWCAIASQKDLIGDSFSDNPAKKIFLSLGWTDIGYRYSKFDREITPLELKWPPEEILLQGLENYRKASDDTIV